MDPLNMPIVTRLQLRGGIIVLRFRSVLLIGFASFLAASSVGLPAQEKIEVDAQAQSTPFPHFWEQMFGSGRAILSLRESYREDVRVEKQVADFKYVRFHAIFHDELVLIETQP